MDRSAADRALFQNSIGVLESRFRRAKRTRPAVSVRRIGAPVNQKLEILILKGKDGFEEPKW